MKHPHPEGERFYARDVSNAMFTASIFAASVGMIWDLATGHVSVFDRMLSSFSDYDDASSGVADGLAFTDRMPSHSSNAIAQGSRIDA